jgi:ADP-ribose pyrophosphatase
MRNIERTLLETQQFSVVERTIERPDCSRASLAFIRHPGSVAILPVVDDQHICLIRSRRLTVDKTLIEVPAGTREPNESPLETAERELAEETGYRAAVFTELRAFYPAPGITDERTWLYVATGLTLGEPAREANEEIENLVISLHQARAMITSGEIEDAKTIIALTLYEHGSK